MSLDVDPEVLAASGSAITAQGDTLAAAASALDGALSASDAMSGHDAAGITFGINYTRDGQALLSAADAAVNACRNIGFGISMSATNYSRAEAASTTGGGEQPLPTPTAPTKFTGPTMPSPYGPGVAEPLLWGLVESFVGDFWPDGEPSELRAAASAWRTFGSAVTASSGEMSTASAGVTSQHIPEGAAMTTAVNEIGQNLTALATQCETTAGQLEGFAGQVEATQNAIRDLLHRLSLSGIVEELGSIFSGRNPWQEVKEVADDIQAVMDNMKRQAEGAESMFQMGISELDSAVNSLEEWTRKEFVHYLGEDVGNATATVVNGYLDLQYGGLNSAIDAVHGIQQLDPTRFAYDPEGATKTWAGVVDTAALAVPPLLAAKLAQDPDHVLDQVKGIASYDDWNSDHPLRGLGHNLGDLAQLGIPGGAAAKPAVAAAGAETRVAAAAAEAETRAASGALRDAAGGATRAAGTDIGVQGSKIADNLNGIKVPESSTPSAGPGPSVTPELKPPVDAPTPHVEPQAAPDAPAPHAPEHTPAVPDTAPPPRAPETASAPVVSDAPAPRAPELAPAAVPESVPAHANAPASGGVETPTSPAASAPHAPADYTPPSSPSASHPSIDSPSGGGAPAEAPHASVPEHAPGGPHDPPPPHHGGSGEHPSGAGGDHPGADRDGHHPTETEGSHPQDGDLPDGSDGSGPNNAPTAREGPGFDYPLPADDALQIAQDPAAELARLADGKVPQSILDGYDPLGGRSLEDFQQEFTLRDSDGAMRWDWDNQAPHNGFAGNPIETASIPESHQLDRLGSNGGGFMADEGAPMGDRAMPPGAAAQYHTFEGTGREAPAGKDWVVEHGPAKSAFGQPGGAEQWVVIDRKTGQPVPIDELIDARMLRETTPPGRR